MAKKRKNEITRQTVQESTTVSTNGELLNVEISERAYFLWQKRGCPQGDPEEDWNRAIEELTYERSRLHP